MQLQPTESALQAKQNTAAFVHGVAEMEVQAFTLRETARKIREESEAKEKIAANHLSVAFEKLEKQKRTCQNFSKTYSYRDFLIDAGRVTFFAFLGLGSFFSIVILSIVSIVLRYLFGLLNGDGDLLYFVLCAFPVVLAAFQFIFWRSEHSAYLTNRKNNAEKAQIALTEATKAYADAQNVFQQAQQMAQHAHNKATELDASAAYIESRLQQCYGLNIIPPSYRKLVYAVLLDEIYMNDKADTMREAILICDTEIRHGQLISKLDDIYHSLQTLAESIQIVGALLHSIQSNTAQISQSIYQMAGTQEQIAYAAEAVQRTAENADTYMYQRRVGII